MGKVKYNVSELIGISVRREHNIMATLKSPKRIQRKRISGWHNPPSTRYCGRGTRWGNVFRIGGLYPCEDKNLTRDDVLLLNRMSLEILLRDMGVDRFVREYLLPLSGYRHLSCFCPRTLPCHVDLWIDYLRLYRPEIEMMKKQGTVLTP